VDGGRSGVPGRSSGPSRRRHLRKALIGRKEKSEANFALSTSLPELYFFFFAGFLAAFLVFFAAFFFAAIFTHLHPTE
jgi:hypothetical protein